MTHVQLDACITIVRQCRMTLLNWAYLPYSGKKKKQKKESVKASERGEENQQIKTDFAPRLEKKGATLTASPSALGPAAHNAAETRGSCQAQGSLGGN